MASLKGSKTEKNILTAFAGESQARNRYTFFAKQAKKEGYEQIAAVFAETADQEMAHAKRLFNFLEGGEVEITAAFPAGRIGGTIENLKAAAAGEKYEHTSMYPEFAEIARSEGFDEIAAVMKAIGVAEQMHEKRYLALAANIENGRVFQKGGATAWKCRKCGYVHQGQGAPDKCPACAHPQSYYEVKTENW
jgi:rubrerythrin